MVRRLDTCWSAMATPRRVSDTVRTLTPEPPGRPEHQSSRPHRSGARPSESLRPVRQQSQDAGPEAGGRPRGLDGRDGARHGREWSRQGVGGSGGAPGVAPAPPCVHQGQLRRPAGRPARERALRLRARGLRRCLSPQTRKIRGGQRWQHLSRRGRRDAAAVAGQGPARPSGSRVLAPGSPRGRPARRPRDCGHEAGI